jgi:hypothetical protein
VDTLAGHLDLSGLFAVSPTPAADMHAPQASDMTAAAGAVQTTPPTPTPVTPTKQAPQ